MSTLIERYSAVVCDLDGVVYRGPEAVDHAVSALSSLSVPIVYATNNASRPPGEVAAHLTELGLHASGRDVATSSQAGAEVLARHLPRGAGVLAVGGSGVHEALQAKGFRVLEPRDLREDASLRPEGVLQGYGQDVTASDLAEAAYAVAAGALWVATNTDETLPTHRGTAPGNGMLVAAVRRAVDRDPVVVGKPEAPLYELCADRLDMPARRVLAVGDRLETDVAGAVATGMDSVLVLTGVDSVTTLATAPPAMRPTYLVEDLRALGAAYEAAETDYSWWECGGDRRRLVDGRWDVARTGTPIESARAAVACLHQAIDDDELDDDAARRLVQDLDVWQ
ncbi:HAD-IIA family hydrolase [Phycicoccus sp. Soil748]|uniref:HAD-IIA family hydrolase n=1 Tax=Phycicoccus sp. Soil748 TaxID=1736397 RepID=UPI0009E93958|nr:HAD-IIA family hydrolase [Phycicoccus sp. Soil748]